MFVLFIGGTELSKIPGLSAAGADHKTAPFTATADAELVMFGQTMTVSHIPTDPQGHPTPAVLTRASLDLLDEPWSVAVVGAYSNPAPPFTDLGAQPGRDPSIETAVPDARRIFDTARLWAEQSFRGERRVTIAESVPGGTTTALLVLRALGYGGMVSSAGPENPIPIKERVWADASARVGIGVGGFKGCAIDAVRELGDPMQAACAGFAAGLPKGAEIILAGGTQMLAVAAVMREMMPYISPTVSTTPYVSRDKSANFHEIAAEIGVETRVPGLDLSISRHKGLADYELGFVKEGVGAGGAVWMAERAGVSMSRLVARADVIYDHIISKKQQKFA